MTSRARSRQGGSVASHDDGGDTELEDIELELLLSGVARRYGYDFRGYATETVRRRVRRAMSIEGVGTVSELQARVLHDRAALGRLVAGLSAHATGFFRDPSFFRSLREHVVPVLRTFPFTRLWLVGCATGEEAWSLAVMLDEEGLYDRCRIYATDVSHDLLTRARVAVYPRATFGRARADHRESGGHCDLERWLEDRGGNVVVRDPLRRNLLFSHHNLVSDASFNEFQLILCRNVLVYFEPALRQRAQGILHQSLRLFGFVGLGERDPVGQGSLADDYEIVAPCLYRRVR